MSKGILSINGNRAMNYLLQTIFEKEYRFIPVSDVYQGMHYLRSEKQIVALIVDVDFQPQQSWEFIEHIKTSKLFQMPVIILATDNTESVRQQFYEFRADEIFFKPFDPMDITRVVKSGTNILTKA
jgi:CheY-like chemotaxis protein